MKYSELVKTVVLPPLSPQGRPEDPIVVRVEIFKDDAGFYPTVWFQESFLLRPTFPMDENGQPLDETDPLDYHGIVKRGVSDLEILGTKKLGSPREHVWWSQIQSQSERLAVGHSITRPGLPRVSTT